MACNHDCIKCTDNVFYCAVCGAVVREMPVEPKKMPVEPKKTPVKRKSKKEED